MAAPAPYPYPYPPPGWRPPPVDPTGRPLADFGSRALGYVVDTAIWLLPTMLFVVTFFALFFAIFFGAVARSEERSGPPSALPFAFLPVLLLLALLVSLAQVAYYAELVHRRGQTFGQRVAHVMVVDGRTGGPVGRGQAWGRAACRALVSSQVYGLGFWWALLDERRRTLHDVICNTVVIQLPR